MFYRKVTAIIPTISLEDVEKELEDIGAPGITITKVHGSGNYRDYYAKDTLSNYSHVEIFTEETEARNVSNTIAKTVSRGMSTEGVIAIVPVEEFIHIKDFKEVTNDE